MNQITHVEIAGRDGTRLESFYSDLLQWKVNRVEAGGHSYGRIDGAKNPSIGIRHEPEGKPEIVVYVQVDSVNEIVEKAKALGAEVRISPRDGGEVYFALINDPEGNPIGLTQRNA